MTNDFIKLTMLWTTGPGLQTPEDKFSDDVAHMLIQFNKDVIASLAFFSRLLLMNRQS